MSQIEDLEKLADLKKKGIITEEEFEAQKKVILENINFGTDEEIPERPKSAIGYYKLCFKKYVQFSGRASRSEYWWFWLFNFLINLVLGFLYGFFGYFNSLLGMIFDWSSTIYSLIVLLPSLAVFVRRYHDIGKSAWFAFTGTFILIGYFIISLIWLFASVDKGAPENIYSMLLPYLGVTGLVSLVIGLIWGIIFPCFASQKGTNKYGPQP